MLVLVSLDNAKYEFELKNIASQYSQFASFKFVEMDDADKTEIRLWEEEGIVFGIDATDAELRYTDTVKNYEKSSKNAYKRVLYRLLKKRYGISLDWGILTGIRPTKLFQEYVLSYDDMNTAREDFVKQYMISPQKANVLEKVYFFQAKCLDTISKEDYSIYVSVPFCPSRCSYCTFYSNDVIQKSHLIDSYLNALERELQVTLNTEWVQSRKATSLYIGGGTPSSLDHKSLDRFLKLLFRHMDFSQFMEITFEAGRPDTLDQHKLELIHSYGIQRISINPQTMVESTLQKIGRKHSVRQIMDSYQMAREIGFSNINMDMILGLENETIHDVTFTLGEILKLKPDAITVHSLALKKSSELSKRISNETKDTQSLEVVKMIQAVYDALEKEYSPYYLYRQKNIMGGQENVGFSQNGKESLYNIIIIEEYQNILAFGPGAISRFVYPKENRIEKTSNTKNLEHYINHIDQYIERKIQEMKYAKNN